MLVNQGQSIVNLWKGKSREAGISGGMKIVQPHSLAFNINPSKCNMSEWC